jgi:hypothetical protein
MSSITPSDKELEQEISRILGEPATGTRGQGGLPVTGTVTDWEMRFTKAGKEHLVKQLASLVRRSNAKEIKDALEDLGQELLDDYSASAVIDEAIAVQDTIIKEASHGA